MGKHIRDGWCKYFTGTERKICEAGVAYDTVNVRHEPMDGPNGHKLAGSIPCIAKYNLCGATCEKLEFPTGEEVDAQKAEDQRREDLLRQGLSWCCEVPIDRSQVIESGRYKGHGRRLCSKCRRTLFIV